MFVWSVVLKKKESFFALITTSIFVGLLFFLIDYGYSSSLLPWRFVLKMALFFLCVGVFIGIFAGAGVIIYASLPLPTYAKSSILALITAIGMEKFINRYLVPYMQKIEFPITLGVIIVTITAFILILLTIYMIRWGVEGKVLPKLVFIFAGALLLASDRLLLQDLYPRLHQLAEFIAFSAFVAALYPYIKRFTEKFFLLKYSFFLIFLLISARFWFLNSPSERTVFFDASYKAKYLRTLVHLSYRFHLFQSGSPPHVRVRFKRGFKVLKTSCPPKKRLSGHPSILVITIDALSYDQVMDPTGSWPNLHNLLNSSITFEHAYSTATYTTMSFANMLTGCFALKDSGCLPIARLFKDNGYATGFITDYGIHTHFKKMFSANPGFWFLKPFKGKYPWILSGFDYMKFIKYGVSQHGDHDPSRGSYRGGRITDAAIDFLKSYGGKRFFLWVHYFDVHEWQYESRLGWIGSWTHPKVAYREILAKEDKDIGRLLDFVYKSDFGKNTIIVLTGDHSEALGFRGFNTHSMWVYHCLIHVPLAFRIPGYSHTVRKSPVSLIDLYNTLSALAGIKLKGSHDGCDYTSVILDKDYRPAFRRLLYFVAENQAGVMQYPYKLDYAFQDMAVRLFNIEKDPMEQQELLTQFPQIKDRLLFELESFLRRFL